MSERMTLVIETVDGGLVAVDRIRQLLGHEFKVKTWKDGDAIDAGVALAQAVDALDRAARVLGNAPSRRSSPSGELVELSCGACGAADMRLRALGDHRGRNDNWIEVDAICQGCGSVTHLAPGSRPRIEKSWGRPERGEKDDGLLCAMPWPAREGEPHG